VGSMGQVNKSDEKDAQSNSSHVRLKPSLTKARALCRNGLIPEVIKQATQTYNNLIGNKQS
jgi:hypothetical protein